jgi:multidrug efflux pump subunit AcrA (membrane-fusion protein)
MYAHVTLSTPDPHPLLYVPDNTILIDSNGTRVVTVDADHKIHFKSVTLGRDFGAKSEIVSGLSPGDMVVQNPTDDLQEGMTVSVQG